MIMCSQLCAQHYVLTIMCSPVMQRNRLTQRRVPPLVPPLVQVPMVSAQHYVLSIMCSALCAQHYVLYIMCSAFPKKRYREWISKANNSDKMIALDFLAAKYLKSDESFDEVLSHLQVCRPHSHVCVHAHLYVSTCVCSLLCAHLILRTEEFVGHIPRPRPGQL